MSNHFVEPSLKSSNNWRRKLRSVAELLVPFGLVLIWLISLVEIIFKPHASQFTFLTAFLLSVIGLVFILIKKNWGQSFMLTYIKHEVRTPLNTILGLLTEFQHELPQRAQLKKDLAVLHRSAIRLSYLLEDAMNAEEIENGNFKLKEDNFSLRNLISDLDSVFLRICNEKNIKYSSMISKNLPDQYIGDERRIVQVLWNLLHNACKFTDQGGVSFCVSEDKTMDTIASLTKNIVFEVRDSGKGMQQDNMKNIFEKFVTSKNRHYGGTGLGLWISDKIAHAMKAEITVKSELGVGSSFKLVIELKQNSKDIPRAYFRRVLVVEDSIDTINLMKLYLGNVKSTRFDFVTNCADAKNKLNETQFDAVFLDFRLPDGHGVDFLKQVKSKYPGIYWIAMSADQKDTSEFNAILQKPMRKNDLLKFFVKTKSSKPIKRQKAA